MFNCHITYQRYPGDAEWSAIITPYRGAGAILDEKSPEKPWNLYVCAMAGIISYTARIMTLQIRLELFGSL